MKFLLVDDSRVMRNIQKTILGKGRDIQFVEASDGIEALNTIESAGKLDLIMIDWNMPKMDGLTLVLKIRLSDKKTPLIMCTTEAEKSQMHRALEAGVNNYICKPFTPEFLQEKVEQTLAIARVA